MTQRWRVRLMKYSSTYLGLLVISLTMLLPFFWLLLSSFKTMSELFANPIKWVVWPLDLGNYAQALTTIPFWSELGNTLLLVVTTVIGTVLSSSMAAYGLAKIVWPLRGVLFSILIATMILPGIVTFIPTYLIFRDLGWLGTFLPLIVPSFLGTPYYIFLFRQFFLNIPDSVCEAGRVDGASELRIFIQIILPMSKPALTAVAILTFVGAWTDYLGPLIYLNSNTQWTLSLGLSAFLNTHTAEWNLLMAAAVVFTVPMILVFFVGQRYFMKGISFTTDVG